MKFSFLFFLCCLFSACANSQSNHIIEVPNGSAIVVDGIKNQDEWKDAYLHEDEKNGVVLLKQTETTLLIGVPIEKHKTAKAEQEAKTYLSFTEIAIAINEQDTILLHASSLNGMKSYRSEADFNWTTKELWKANAEGGTKNGEDFIVTLYEYEIQKTLFEYHKEVAIKVYKLPFYTDEFPVESIPNDEGKWLKLKL